VAAVGEVETEHGVAGIAEGVQHAEVGVRAGVRLDVGMRRPEQVLCPRDGEQLISSTTSHVS